MLLADGKDMIFAAISPRVIGARTDPRLPIAA